MGVEIFAAWHSFLHWQKNLPGLRAARLPKFGSEAFSCFWGAIVFLILVHSHGPGRWVAWFLFGFMALLIALFLCAYVFQTALMLLIRLRKESVPQIDRADISLVRVVSHLPFLSSLVWEGVQLMGHSPVWFNRLCLIIWVNYFAVGCAVALRRGVDDLVRSRKARI